MKARILPLALALSLIPALAALAADAPAGEKAAAAEADAYMAKALEAIETRHLSEAIRSYVAALARAEAYPSLRPRAAEAEAALAMIGARLTLEPSSDWVDAKGAQTAGSTRELAKGGGRAPAVFLFESFGEVKSPVADASISFAFERNSGTLIGSAATDAYGEANSSVFSLDEPGEEAVIRAFPEFLVDGRAYAFKDVFRDFAYLPSIDAALVASLERSEFGPSDDPKSIAAVSEALGPIGIELAPRNGKLSEPLFLDAFGGKLSALAAMGLSDSLPYAAFALVEVSPSRQMEYDGKKYEIYTASAAIGFRIVRSDGSVLFSLKPASAMGQGGSREAAVADAYRRSGIALSAALRERGEEIGRLLKAE